MVGLITDQNRTVAVYCFNVFYSVEQLISDNASSERVALLG